MSWVLTKQLQAFRDQMDAAFPHRDRKSDGTIGDAAHQAEKSGHNPDLTANAEYKDGDAKDEVRALDVDADTGDPDVSMEDIVQHLLRLARAGNLWMIRYMIFNRRDWSANDGWKQHPYAGASAHTEHLHLSGAYNQTSDELASANYHLDELVDTMSKQDALDALEEFFARDVTKDAAGVVTNITSQVGRDAFDQFVPNGLTGMKTTAWTALQNLGTAVGKLSTVVAQMAAGAVTEADIDALKAAVEQVDEQVAARLVGETPEATAAALKAVLGDQAAAVGRILAAA